LCGKWPALGKRRSRAIGNVRFKRQDRLPSVWGEQFRHGYRLLEVRGAPHQSSRALCNLPCRRSAPGTKPPGSFGIRRSSLRSLRKLHHGQPRRILAGVAYALLRASHRPCVLNVRRSKAARGRPHLPHVEPDFGFPPLPFWTGRYPWHARVAADCPQRVPGPNGSASRHGVG